MAANNQTIIYDMEGKTPSVFCRIFPTVCESQILTTVQRSFSHCHRQLPCELLGADD